MLPDPATDHAPSAEGKTGSALSADERRPRDADATRRALLRAAQRRFVLLGFERTTTRDIAADAGVNLALINRYFGGKQGLFEAVVEGFPALLAEAAPPVGDDPVGEFIDRLADTAWPELGAHPLVLLMRDDGDERVRELRAQALGGIVDRLGDLPEGDDAALRAQLVLALMCGIVALRNVVGLDAIAGATPDQLRGPMDDAIAALLKR